jgi:NADH-quinone oxidoreductase subunit N
VYDGSPTIITAYMSTIVKIAGFAAIYRLFNYAFPAQVEYWSLVFAGICVLTLLIGNITAVYQQSFKRMMAYSGISHTGYIVLALLTANSDASQTIFFYSTAYILASAIAFLILIKVEESTKNEDIDSFNGLAKNNPWMAFCMTVAMASLAGLPLTAGFIGKFSVFTSAISEGYLAISIFAIIMAMVSLYYYFKVIIAMYFKSNPALAKMEGNIAFHIAVGLSTILTLTLGVYPNLLFSILY